MTTAARHLYTLRRSYDILDDISEFITDSYNPPKRVVEFGLGIVSYLSTDLQPGHLLAVSFDSAKISCILSSNRVRDDSLDPITEICSIVGRQLYVHFGYPFTNEQLTS